MPPVAFDNLQKAGFAGFVFPVSEITLTGGMRDHVHEYPHSPGGAPEKLGRKLYECRMRAPMKQGLKGYPNLWPETLQSLRIIFEGGRSFDLVIPTVGTITAYCTSWVETSNFQKDRTGVEYELSFREDQSNLFLVEELIAKTGANFVSHASAYAQVLADQKTRAAQSKAAVPAPDRLMLARFPAEELAMFEQIASVAAKVLAVLGAIISVGAAIAELAAGLAALCATADETSTVLQDPTRYELTYALHNVWRSAQQLANDAQQRGVTVVHYAVPTLMAIGDVSTAIYGDASHAIDLLSCNAVEDAFAIPAGTVLKAYRFDNNATSIAAA